MSVEVFPVDGLAEVRPGDDLASMLEEPLRALGARSGDVVVVTQKVVSKAEGRVVPDGDRAGWVERETERVVARRGDLTIAATRHGFVCANAGVDASNVDGGGLTLLPVDPDGSAERIRSALTGSLAIEDLGVVITDTFGRAWREGVINVAIGVAGIPALIDLRGAPDHTGRELEATIVALADEIAAASGLVMGKAARVPAALVRGVATGGARPGRGADLVRGAQDDLFRESPLQSLHARRTIRSFAPGPVPREALEEAICAACTAPAPHHTRPWRFSVLTGAPAKRGLLAAIAEAWRADLRGDATPEDVIARRIANSDAVLGQAPVLIVPWVSFSGSHPYGDAERSHAEQEMFMLSGGAAIQNLMLALHAQGLASCWVSSTLFCKQETREALGLSDEWIPLGSIAIGRPAGGSPPPRPDLDVESFVSFADSAEP